MPLAEFKEKCINLIQAEFIAERTKRRVDMLEKEVEKMAGNKPYQEGTTYRTESMSKI